MPWAAQASASIAQAAPESDTIAARLPAGTRPSRHRYDRSISRVGSATAATPSCRNAASYACALPAIAAVCDAAAWAPLAERPALSKSIGLPARRNADAAAMKGRTVAHLLDIADDGLRVPGRLRSVAGNATARGRPRYRC